MTGGGENARALRGGERCASTQAFGLGGFQVGAGRPHVGLGGRTVELDQNVARLHQRAVGGVDGGDPAGLDRLDHLDPAGRLELALSGGDDVDAPEIGEPEADDDERADDPEKGHANGRRRRFQDLEDGREKFPVRRRAAAGVAKRQRLFCPPLERPRLRGFAGGGRADDVVHAATTAGFAWRPQR